MIVAVGREQSLMVIGMLAIVPGQSGSVAIIDPVPGPFVAINAPVNLPVALVIVAVGTRIPREGLLTESLTITPASAGLPFTNT
ncbi:hypothetical protein [Peribacillus simplex]|uniref:hypothetical protein n=1 Tax=Peribacillus simplex TaxID=1478 RepID=UPI001E54082B|nr:hypothetical protein [Peribacillus simplex]